MQGKVGQAGRQTGRQASKQGMYHCASENPIKPAANKVGQALNGAQSPRVEMGPGLILLDPAAHHTSTHPLERFTHNLNTTSSPITSRLFMLLRTFDAQLELLLIVPLDHHPLDYKLACACCHHVLVRRTSDPAN
jgi:hypothetical protein